MPPKYTAYPMAKRARVWAPDYEQTDLTNFCFIVSDGKLWCSIIEVTRRSPYFADMWTTETKLPYEYDVCAQVPGTTVAEFRTFLDEMLYTTNTYITPKFYGLALLFRLPRTTFDFEQHVLDYDEKTQTYPNLDAFVEHCKDDVKLFGMAVNLLKIRPPTELLLAYNGTPFMEQLVRVLHATYEPPLAAPLSPFHVFLAEPGVACNTAAPPF